MIAAWLIAALVVPALDAGFGGETSKWTAASSPHPRRTAQRRCRLTTSRRRRRGRLVLGLSLAAAAFARF